MRQADFHLPNGHYLASHSAGRPLRSALTAFTQDYFEPWAGDHADPWLQWLPQVERFCNSLSQLFNADVSGFCPQSNVSSGVAKVVMSLPQLQQGQTVLMSEHDFPSIGFAMQHALPGGKAQLRFIPRHLDVTDPQVWLDYIDETVGLVWLTHGFSNLGCRAPIEELLPQLRQRGILSAIDIAQTAGVIPLDFSQLQPDFAFGSCLKWLCGGAGAGYLWVNPKRVADCQPKDVGWFSHQQPFEMDIHDFRYHPSALRFWGGTPSVAPLAFARHSIDYLLEVGIDEIRRHNLSLQHQLIEALGDAVVSPKLEAKRSGTVIINFGDDTDAQLQRLHQANIHLDARPAGIRVSPHLYNSGADIEALLAALG